MSHPRRLIANTTYLLTRRCTQRQFLLKPTELSVQIFAYVLAMAAQRFNVVLHAVCVLSNHWHAVVTDTDARMPEFTAYVHKYVAKCLNASLGRWENLWASEPPSMVALEDAIDVLDKVLYTLCNPVSSHLVKSGDSWTGLRADWTSAPQVIERPAVFFREDGDTPEEVVLEFSAPPLLANIDLQAELAARENNLLATAKKEGKKFLGLAAIARQRPTDTPTSREPRRKLSPRVAAKDQWRRIEALRRLKAFGDAYREAWNRWKAGVRDVVFPAGTYAMRVHHSVECAAT